MITTLKDIDPSFEPAPRPFSNQSDAYITADKLKVEFITPMRGPVEDAPVPLPALGTASQPLRFLDYLIYHERKAAIPFGPGILVNVPDPVRYAWHKLIVAERRRMPEKVPKDLVQAETLFDVLVEDRPDDVRDMWEELATEGRRNWQQIALDGLKAIATCDSHPCPQGDRPENRLIPLRRRPTPSCRRSFRQSSPSSPRPSPDPLQADQETVSEPPERCRLSLPSRRNSYFRCWSVSQETFPILCSCWRSVMNSPAMVIPRPWGTNHHVHDDLVLHNIGTFSRRH
jgi:hypothetical protein